MQAEDWSRAREAALQAAELEPLCPNVLFRLSACYGQEKDFPSAHRFCERGLALLSPQERVAHLEKFKRLEEQSKDALDNVYREDPFDIFPLEVLLNIFRFGLESDQELALRASWVNRRWRSTIILNCPELWKTWITSHTSLLGKHSDEKYAAWRARSGGHFDTLQFKDISLTSASRVGKKTLRAAKNVTRLDIQARDRFALARLASYIQYNVPAKTFDCVESLRIAAGPGERYRGRYGRRDQVPATMSYGLQLEGGRLCDIELENINFVPEHNRRSYAHQYLTCYRIPPPVARTYPALTRLVIHGCEFDDQYAQLTTDGPDSAPKKFQADTLHTALRGVPNLEHLDVLIPWTRRREAQNGLELPVSLTLLRSCRLPPPVCWSIDIVAPHLESLVFALEDGAYAYPVLDRHTGRAFIPSPQDYPLTDNVSGTLQSVELICGFLDKVSSFTEWIPRFQTTAKLGIHDLEAWPYPDAPVHLSTRTLPATRLSNVVLGLLHDNPLWFPKMQSLDIHSCFTPGRTLVSWIRKRRSLTGCAAIQRLVLTSCSTLSEYARILLEQEVADFQVHMEFQPHNDDQKRIQGLHMDDDFEVDAPVKMEHAAEIPPSPVSSSWPCVE